MPVTEEPARHPCFCTKLIEGDAGWEKDTDNQQQVLKAIKQ
jgi:hypothetical protein